MNKNIATLKLFNAIQVNFKSSKVFVELSTLSKTIPNGYILDASIDSALIPVINNVLGFSGKMANASFHKSWSIIRDLSIFELTIQQIAHYITTYGFESMGIFKDDYVYIPNEVLDIPELKDDIPLLVVRGLTSEEILSKILSLGSGIALSKETLECIITIIKESNYNFEDFSAIKNRELLIGIYDCYGRCPVDPVEFLRFVVYKLTGETLLIKNNYLIEKIKESDHRVLDRMIEQSPKNLGSIFFRYKPLFLAMKHASYNKTFFNQLRKSAKTQHIPMGEDYLNTITDKIYNDKIDWDIFTKKIEDYSIFRKIRLLYALNFRLGDSTSIVYRVRNGKGWATDFDKYFDPIEVNRAYSILFASIASDMKDKVSGKTFFIPDDIHYAIPSTEKQFVGNVPSNSFIEVDSSLIFGVHWYNLPNKRVDLDLSVSDLHKKYGWDSNYRLNDTLLFSGDLTDAPKPNGASELFYIEHSNDPKVINLNYYNYYENGDDVDYQFFVGKGKKSDIDRNYMIDMNNMIGVLSGHKTKKQDTIGLFMTVNGKNRVYFSNFSTGKSITSKNNDAHRRSLEFFIKSCRSTLDLKHLLLSAGASVVSELPKDSEYVDLSLNTIDKNTIISLFQ